MSKTKEDVILSPEEQELIASARAKQEKVKKAEDAILRVLKKHNATLAVNPNSPLNNIQIVVKVGN